VTAHDVSNISPNKDEATVEVTVTDYNDNAPKFINLPMAITVKENEIHDEFYVLQVRSHRYRKSQGL